jgi:hypothetical protein
MELVDISKINTEKTKEHKEKLVSAIDQCKSCLLIILDDDNNFRAHQHNLSDQESIALMELVKFNIFSVNYLGAIEV